MNSPEGAEKVTEALVAPRTQETPEGGAEPIPAPTVPSTTDVQPGPSPASSELTRGQKAAATRAKNRAAGDKATASTPPAVTAPADAPAGSASTPAPDPTLTDDHYLERIATALERIADAMAHAQATEPF